MVHGDDFVVVGDRQNIGWFKKELQKRFEIKTKIVGSRGIMDYQNLGNGNQTWADLTEDQNELEEVDEAGVLNRIVRITGAGWEYEADQRHADLLVEGLNMTNANSTTKRRGRA